MLVLRAIPGLKRVDISYPSARLVVRHSRDDIVRLWFADLISFAIHEIHAAQRTWYVRVTEAECVPRFVCHDCAQL